MPLYIKALEKEIQTRSGGKEKIDTLYFGGGTPSLVPVKEIETLLKAIERYFIVSTAPEITLEVNPGTVDQVYLKDLRQLGINRLSIGVQSFNDDKLSFLNRIHSADQAEKSFIDAQKAGFENITMDLIYGLPFETQTEWLKDLNRAMGMSPSHLSCYMLTIEPGTPLYDTVKKGRVHPLDAGIMSGLFKKTSQVLTRAGYDHYEISSFSNGKQNRSRHNSKYWDMTPYLGFGAAAHSYDGNTRSWNHRDIDAYIKDIHSGKFPVEDKETLTIEQKMLEMVMLRLRTRDGLSLNKFQTLFHIDFKTRFREILTQVLEDGLGYMTQDRFSLTLEGKLRLNSIVEAFAQKIL